MDRFNKEKIEELKKLSEGKIIIHQFYSDVYSISKTLEGAFLSFDKEEEAREFYFLDIKIHDNKSGFSIEYKRYEKDYWNTQYFFFTDFIENL